MGNCLGKDDRVRPTPQSLTLQAQMILLEADKFAQGMAEIKDKVISASVREYFTTLLQAHCLSSHEAVRHAGLDKDYGRQILQGERMGRRDYYIQIAFGMQLTIEETQSMLSYLGVGQLYALRKRDAAIMYALKEKMNLMDIQLLLDQQRLTPLGDAEDMFSDYSSLGGEMGLHTTDMEQKIKQARSVDDLGQEPNDESIRMSTDMYFTELLSARGITRRQAIDLAGLRSKSNLAFQLLNGTRTAKNRDMYIRFAIGLKLNVEETQRMLKFLKKGALYPLKIRDAALIYAISHGYSIDETQRLLMENGLAEL